MTVDELSAMIEECAGESVLHEAYAVDPEQTRTTLEKLVDDWNAGKDFDPAVYDLLMGRVVERDGDSAMQTGWLKQQAVSDLQALRTATRCGRGALQSTGRPRQRCMYF